MKLEDGSWKALVIGTRAFYKKNFRDGEFCILCKNFCPYAENNFNDKFLCYSCNTYVHRIMLGLEK